MAITTDRFNAVASIYAGQGLDPLPVPCMRVEPGGPDVLVDARKASSSADLLLITSARTVDLLWPDQPMPGVDIAAVGEATAAAVAGAGGRVVVAGRSGLLGLIEMLADRLGDGRVVFPHAGRVGLVASRRLRELAPGLEEHVVYRTVPVAPRLTPVGATVFASPSAVQGWLMTRDFDDVVVAVIGETTRAAVARHRSPDVVAPRPSHRALAMTLMNHLGVRA